MCIVSAPGIQDVDADDGDEYTIYDIRSMYAMNMMIIIIGIRRPRESRRLLGFYP